MTKQLRIATRESRLAMWQAEHVKARLEDAHVGLVVELLPMTTQGDQLLDSPLARIGGKGLFVKELERALLDGRADIAVHSMKDVPAAFPPGLHLPVILQREDPLDAFVSNHHDSLEALPPQARVGTASLRRQCQLLSHRPDLRIETLRGNVQTRLRKLDEGDYDAIILACAGLKRLGLGERITAALPASDSLPAIGQGAIGIECRENDPGIEDLLAPLHDTETALCVSAERAVNARMGGNCTLPLAAFAERDGQSLKLRALLGEPDGQRLLRAEVRGEASRAEALGTEAADQLFAQGAEDILNRLNDGA